MKVCTDACILGAWFSTRVPEQGAILDIGSGSGLLMMMLAQRTRSEIHGIEIDLPSFRQLTANISQNHWKERLKAYHGDARTYTFNQQYDFIIANPPFFEDDLHAASPAVQVAKHSTLLTLDELISTIDKNLSPEGSFGVLLPYHRWEYFDKLAQYKGFHLVEKLFVRESLKHPFFRAILQYGRRQRSEAPEYQLTIRQIDGSYTGEFVELLRAYYLYL